MNSRPVVSFILIAFLLAGVLAPSVARAQEGPRVTDELLAEFETIVQDEMAYYHIPGVAIAVIQDAEVVYAQGFGVRDVASGEPFTAETQFRIGSTTKSITSLLAAQLVDEGLLSWDVSPTTLYPDYALPDADLTAKVTLRDLMGMNTGLGPSETGALQWGVWTAEDLLAALVTLPVHGEFRNYYEYNNEVYASAGYMATIAAGLEPTLENYKTLVQERIFDPIGMPSAIITDDLNQISDNYSKSYEMALLDSVLDPFESSPTPIGVVAPAGAVWTNLNDMARYVITQMNGGVTPDGTRIVSEENLAETWKPQVSMGEAPSGLTNSQYAMGWVASDLYGYPVRYHDGGWNGYRTLMTVYPDANAGLIIFTNHTFGDIYNYVLMFAFQQLLHGEEPAAVAEGRSTFDQLYGVIDETLAQLPPVEVDPAVVSPLVGTYEEGWAVELREDNTLWATAGAYELMLRPLPMENTYIGVNGALAGTLLIFDPAATPVTMTMQLGEEEFTIAMVE